MDRSPARRSLLRRGASGRLSTSVRYGLLALLLGLQLCTSVVSHNSHSPLQWRATSWQRDWPFRWYVRFDPHKYRTPKTVPRYELAEFRGHQAHVQLFPSGMFKGLVVNGIVNLTIAVGCVLFCRQWNGRVTLRGMFLFVTYFCLAISLVVARWMPWEHVLSIVPLTAATVGYANWFAKFWNRCAVATGTS